ncbi:DNA polymerase III subunit delta' [Mycoplasma sp. HS2188]|uniref:DNA polymerase III subunit delta' n=1 Tax=Mycoplasma sp. HS2188 TaxID=2976765 RepID=UPI0021AA7B7E|nr:DNA polymerase III subunit delta' [Mycoplasma sp. HS2188]MCT4469731.1 DNA polymerase III subunit delta' [Mycoplasma sp. HS2188]
MIAPNLKRIIDSSVLNNKINHCYLLKSQMGMDIDDNIIYMINAINNQNIDSLENIQYSNIIVADASKNNGEGLKKDEITNIFEQSNFTELQPDFKKIIVFKNIELASNVALNSLLKTIEEPGKNVIFILTTTMPQKLLSTIKSRSFIININRQNNFEIEKSISNLGYDKTQSWFFSHIVTDENEILNSRSFYDFKKIENLINVFISSFKTPTLLPIHLTKMNKKDTHEDLMFHLRCLKFIFSLSWQQTKLMPKPFQQLVKKMNGVNFNFKKAFINIEHFFASIAANVNIFLQAAALLVKLQECYE